MVSLNMKRQGFLRRKITLLSKLLYWYLDTLENYKYHIKILLNFAGMFVPILWMKVEVIDYDMPIKWQSVRSLKNAYTININNINMVLHVSCIYYASLFSGLFKTAIQELESTCIPKVIQ